MINLVFGVILQVSGSPESSKLPDHDSDKTEENEEENGYVERGQGSAFANSGTPFKINGKQIHTVSMFPDSKHKENSECK